MRQVFLLVSALTWSAWAQPARPIVLHAARVLDVESGNLLAPGEVLVEGERIVEAGAPPAPDDSISGMPRCCPA